MDFDKSEDTEELPNVTERDDRTFKIDCGDDKTTEEGFVTIRCRENDWQDNFTCLDGEIISENEGPLNCERMIIECEEDTLDDDCEQDH